MNRPRNTLLWLMLAVLAIKAGLFVWGTHVLNLPPGTPHNWLSIWDHGDAGAYKLLAAQGYFPEGVTDGQRLYIQRFPPLYPALIHLISRGLGQSLVISGMLISLVATVAASFALYRLALLEGLTERQAATSVVLFTLFPTEFFTSSLYAEGLFILGVVATFIALRRERFFLAGLVASATIMTRIVGVCLIPAIAIALFQRFREGRFRGANLSALAIPWLVTLGYTLANAYFFGSPVHFFRAYQAVPVPVVRQWPMLEQLQQAGTLFLDTLEGKVNMAYLMATGWTPIFAFACLGTLVWWLRSKPRPELATYAIVYLMVITSFRHSLSFPRYALGLVPLFLALGQIRFAAVQAGLGLGFGALLLYFVSLFVNGVRVF